MENKDKTSKITVKNVLIVAVVFYLLYYFLGGGQDDFNKSIIEQGASLNQEISNTVAKDAEEKYYIAERNGDKMEIYVHAGIVAAAYLQAKDEENYKKWKTIEEEKKRDAGIQ